MPQEELDEYGIPIKKKAVQQKVELDEYGIPVKKKVVATASTSSGTPSTLPSTQETPAVEPPPIQTTTPWGQINKTKPTPSAAKTTSPKVVSPVMPTSEEKPEEQMLGFGGTLSTPQKTNVAESTRQTIPLVPQEKQKTLSEEELKASTLTKEGVEEEVPIDRSAIERIYQRGLVSSLTEAMRGFASLATPVLPYGVKGDATQHFAYKAADWIENNKAIMPPSDFMLEKQAETTAGQLTQATASLVPMVLAGELGTSLKIGSAILPGALGAFQNGGAEYKRAYATVNDAKTLSDDDFYVQYGENKNYEEVIAAKNEMAQKDAATTAFYASLPATAVGSLEAVPITSFLKRADGLTGGIFASVLGPKIEQFGVKGILSDAIYGGLEEGIEEATTQFLTNVSAYEVYDKTRSFYEGVSEGGSIGFTLGAVLNGMGATLRVRRANPNNTVAENVNIDKSIEYVEEKKAELKDVKDYDFVKPHDDIPIVQELKIKKIEIEKDLANDNISPQIKEQLKAKVDEVNGQIEEAKAIDNKEKSDAVVAQAGVAQADADLAALKSQSEQASSPEAKAIIDAQIAEQTAKKEELAAAIPVEEETAAQDPTKQIENERQQELELAKNALYPLDFDNFEQSKKDNEVKREARIKEINTEYDAKLKAAEAAAQEQTAKPTEAKSEEKGSATDEKINDAFTIAKKLSSNTTTLVNGIGTKASNYTTKDGIEISLTDDDGGDVNGEQVQADFQLDYIGNEKGQRGKGLASKELNRVLAEADKNDLSVSIIVDSKGATTNPVGDKDGEIGLSNEELKNWYKKKGFIFDKNSRYGYRPKKSEDSSKYKAETYQAKENEIKIGENLENQSSPQDLQEAFNQGRLKENVFYEDGDNSIYTVKNGKLKLVDNVDYTYKYEKDNNGKVNIIEEVKLKTEPTPKAQPSKASADQIAALKAMRREVPPVAEEKVTKPSQESKVEKPATEKVEPPPIPQKAQVKEEGEFVVQGTFKGHQVIAGDKKYEVQDYREIGQQRKTELVENTKGDKKIFTLITPHSDYIGRGGYMGVSLVLPNTTTKTNEEIEAILREKTKEVKANIGKGTYFSGVFVKPVDMKYKDADIAEGEVKTEEVQPPPLPISSEKTARQGAAKKVAKALEKTGVTVKFVSPEEMAKESQKRGGEKGAEGVFLSDTGEILIDENNFEEGWGTTVVWHEGVHPILNIIRNTDPKTYDAAVRGLKAAVKANPKSGLEKVLEWAQREYKAGGQSTVNDEGMTESIARIADGKIDLSLVPKGARQVIADFINKIAKALGLGQIVGDSDLTKFRKLAQQISTALTEGADISAIVGEENVKKYESQKLQKSAVGIMQGREDMSKYGLETKKAKTRKVGEALEQRQREKYGTISKNDRSPEAMKKISSWMVEEVKYFIEAKGENSGKGWYGEKYQKGLDAMAEIFPEMKSDKNARDLFTMLVSITSDGQKVLTNFKLAAMAYSHYKNNGKLPEELPGFRIASLKANLARINKMLVEYDGDISRMKEDLMEISSIKEINVKRKSEGLPPLDSDWPVEFKAPLAASVFGPKLGMFFSNLSGNEAYPTLDRWWSRTFNRYRGNIIPVIGKGFTTKGEPVGIDRVKALLKKPKMSDDNAILAIIKNRDSYAAKNYKNGTELEKAANTIYKVAFENLNDAPENKTDRQFMYDTVSMAVKKLNASGLDLSIADAQAILWYFEKNLYKTLGVQAKIEGISYEDAAKTTVQKFRENNSLDYDIDESEDDSSLEGEDDIIENTEKKVQASKGSRAAVGEQKTPETSIEESQKPAFNRGIKAVQQSAEKYKQSTKNISRSSNPITSLYPKVSKMISDAYAKSKNNPSDADVKKAYDKMMEETIDQYDFILSKGLRVVKHQGSGEPYSNSKEMLRDVENNNTLKFLPNEIAFGQGNIDTSDNIGLQSSGRKLKDGYELTNSEVFRIVHDYFGHGILGNQFGAIGEENATLQHLDLYSNTAAPAIIAQTRGQNSWVNFSGENTEAIQLRKDAAVLRKQGDTEGANKLLAEAEKIFKFAEPKIGILPNKFNFRRYETARRINDQEAIDSKPAKGANDLSPLLEAYSAKSRGTRGIDKRDVRRVKRLGEFDVETVAEYSLDEKINGGILKAFPNFKGVQKIYEIKDGATYREMVVNALKDNKFAASVTVHSAEDFSGMRMFVTEDASTGITLTKEGFLGGAFSDPAKGRPQNLAQLMVLGIKEGATTAEAFHTILPDYYSNFGFKGIATTAFNDEYKPMEASGTATKDWDYKTYEKFNDGKPDIVFLAYDGGDRNTIEDRIGLFDDYNTYDSFNVESFDKDGYDQAEEAMKQFAVKRLELDFEQQGKPIPTAQASKGNREKVETKSETLNIFAKAKALNDARSAEASIAKKRELAQERRKLMEDNPTMKEVDDNIKSINDQLEQAGIIKKTGDCP